MPCQIATLRYCLLWAAFAGFVGTGCTVLYDLSANQCTTDRDCDDLGGPFTNRICQVGVCVSQVTNGDDEPATSDSSAPEPGNDSGTPMDASAHGDTVDASAASVDSAPARPDAAGVKPEPFDAALTDTSGTDAQSLPKCETNKQCIEDNFGEPYICKSGRCIALRTPECPIVLPDRERDGNLNYANLKVPEPIIIGAYSTINAQSPASAAATRAFDLALAEFSQTINGLAGGPNNTRRKFVAVVCEGEDLDSAPISASMAHLVDNLGVKGIVASLASEDLQPAFNTWGKPNNVFFLSPLQADPDLANAENNGLLWFLLGPTQDLAYAYPPLLKRAETFQRERIVSVEAGATVRVALIQGSESNGVDIAQALLSGDAQLVFNGKPALKNGDNFKLLQYREGSENVMQLVGELEELKPHIIVTTAEPTFVTDVVATLEARWTTMVPGQTQPFWIWSGAMTADDDLLTVEPLDISSRSAGVNFASAEDDTNYQAYLLNYRARFGNEADDPEDWENFYDAMYYMLYAYAAAGNPPNLDGRDLVRGLKRVTNADSSRVFNVRPSDISNATIALRTGGDIRLNGTLGPPDFNPSTGSRATASSVWCIQATPERRYEYNVLRYRPKTNRLEGTFPCFSGF